MAKIQIAIMECPRGHGFRAIAFEHSRITSSKCCGSWQTVQSWSVDTVELIALINGELRMQDNEAFDAMREKARKNRAKVFA